MQRFALLNLIFITPFAIIFLSICSINEINITGEVYGKMVADDNGYQQRCQ